ncbi:MAG: tetratricopeptide repeat protein [Candidatus Aminicenantes bacterium]|nr:MAG: tetratricopeptide repeat protein [Candidatus Aminicenantes bacterium]
MHRKFTFYLLAFLFLPLFFSGCRSSIQSNQIQFGITAAQRGLWDEAIFRWKKQVQSNPDSAAAHNNLAVAYELKRMWDEARKEYEIALKLSPNNSYIKTNFENFKKNLEAREVEDKKKKNEKK